MRHLSIIFVLMYLFSSASLAEVSRIDEKLKKADEIRSSDGATFLQLLEEINSSYDSLSDDQKSFFSYLSIYKRAFSGEIHINSAIDELEQLLASVNNKHIQFRILSSIVNYHAIVRDYYNGSKSLERLFELRNDIEDQELVNNSYAVAGIFYSQSEQNELALHTAQTLLKNKPVKRKECFGRHLLIDSSYKLNRRLDDSFSYIDSSFEFCDAINEKVISSAILTNKAKFLIRDLNPQKALSLLRPKLDYVESARYKPIVSDYYAALSRAFYDIDNLPEAKKFAELALETTEGIGYTAPRVDSFLILAQLYEKQGNQSKSLLNFKQYHEAEKAYFDELKTNQLAVQQAKHEALEKENQITLLDKENTLLKTQAALSRKEAQNNQLLLALACSVLILLFFWSYRSRRIQVRLRKMAQTDALTGINNRNHFTFSAEQQLRHSKHVRVPVSFILFDLDLFKRINDTYGHQTGDWALKNAVKAASSVCRSNDIIGRMGGEEFALLLPNCSADKAVKIAEMCRKAIEGIDTTESGFDFNITASFGVSDSSVCQYSFDKLYGCADAALYQSKTHGRNQVYQFEEHTPAVFG